MSIAELQKIYREQLSKIYDNKEALAITKLVLEKELEINPLQLALERFRILTTEQQEHLNKILQRLLNHEPVQYILGEADFFGLKFKVNNTVLIPRPETEELLAWIISEYSKRKSELHILDIGTGSGCIAIALAKNLPFAQVAAIDISDEALHLAAENSKLNGVEIKFTKLDILTQTLHDGPYDIIVSNPPYVSQNEKDSLAKHVTDFEPHLALFAPVEDDLAFYKEIAVKSLPVLKKDGYLFFEIHADRANDIAALLKTNGYTNVEIKRDLSGRERMIRAEPTIS